MITGPKYKIARRVGAPIFEKTQSQKFVLRNERKAKAGTLSSRPKSEYGQQLNEKQKARFSYGLTEKQFSNYVKNAILKKSQNVAQSIYEKLESRVDNVVYRLGLSKTRRAGRQMVSHGHILINGTRTTIPSEQVKIGDGISVREGSKNRKLFTENLEERASTPAWLSFDRKNNTAKILAVPQLSSTNDTMFDLNAVVEFYSRS